MVIFCAIVAAIEGFFELVFLRVLFLMMILALPAQAADWLLAADKDEVAAGETLQIELVRPNASSPWPSHLLLRFAEPHESNEAAFVATKAVNASRRVYEGKVPNNLKGVVKVQAVNLSSNRLLLQVEAAAPQAVAAQGKDTDQVIEPQQETTHTAASSDVDVGLGGITLNEPSYFILGNNGGFDARFQYSFKYQLFDELGPVAQAVPWLGQMYLGYTQTSLWDLGANSAPFKDTTYRPSLFWQKAAEGEGWWPESWRVGVEHESNGKDGVDSRSLNTLFVRPEWRYQHDAMHTLAVAPKFYVYLDKNENDDIQEYRGYTDLNVRYGDDDGLLLSTILRMGTQGKGSAQADITWPFKQPVFGKVGGFFHTQVFTGYGQTLLDYNKNADTQIRFGISLVR